MCEIGQNGAQIPQQGQMGARTVDLAQIDLGAK